MSRGVGKREEGAGKRERRALRVASSYERQPTNHKLPFLLSILLALLTLTPLIAGADQQGVIGFPVTGDAVGGTGNIFVRGIASHAWWLDPEVYGDQLFPALDDLQVTTVRLSIDWKVFEPEPGVWDWSIYDRVLGELARRNIVVVADFNTIPPWASTNPETCGNVILEVPTCQLREDMYDEFANAMRAALQRYSWIRHWEFWNEPEMWTYLGNDGPLYLTHLKMFYDIAHEVNPYVVVAAQTLVGPEYMDWLYNTSAAWYGPGNEPWDAVSMHPYNFYFVPEEGQPPLEINYDRVRQMREMMVARGDGHKKIWITEFGWTNEEQWQARNLPVTLDWLQSQPYIEFAHLHMLHDWNDEPHDQFGLMRIIPTPNGYIVLDENTKFEPKELYYNTYKDYPMTLPGRPTTEPGAQHFPETGHSIADPFLKSWVARGGLDGPGLPLTRPYVRANAEGAWVLVQDFERARLEYQPQHAGQPAEVIGASVGREMAAGHANLEAFVPEGPCVDDDWSMCFEETGFMVSGGFRDFWLTHHGEVNLGFPISTEFVEDGVTVQYFERGRLEYRPDHPQQVVMSDLVRQQLIAQGWLNDDGSVPTDDLRLPTRRAVS